MSSCLPLTVAVTLGFGAAEVLAGGDGVFLTTGGVAVVVAVAVAVGIGELAVAEGIGGVVADGAVGCVSIVFGEGATVAEDVDDGGGTGGAPACDSPGFRSAKKIVAPTIASAPIPSAMGTVLLRVGVATIACSGSVRDPTGASVVDVGMADIRSRTVTTFGPDPESAGSLAIVRAPSSMVGSPVETRGANVASPESDR